MSKKRKLLVIALIALLAAGGGAGLGGYRLGKPFARARDLDGRFARVERDMPRDRVLAIMGPPDREGLFFERAYWEDSPLSQAETNRIRDELHYTVETFFLPITFVISLDADGCVVGKHRYD